MSRPQPVRVMAVVLAVLAFLTGTAGLTDLIPKVVMAWLIVIYGVVQVAWGAWTATQVTPLVAPQAADGTALVPAGSPAAGAGPAVVPSPDAGYTSVVAPVLSVVLCLVVLFLLLALLR